jgi:two-component system chemotaxis response regulator CheB
MPGHDIIVIGFSAGGVEALARLIAALPQDLPAALFVVHHFPAKGVSVLPEILRRSGRLPAFHPKHGQPIEHGRVYIAPPDRHLLIHGNRVHLSRGPRENGYRPAIDSLFRTAARTFGSRVVGVLLSGSLDDGVAGLMDVKRQGGVAVVQDPADALYPGMPRNAIQRVPVDQVVPLHEIAPILTRLAQEAPSEPVESDVAEDGRPDLATAEHR